MFCTTCGAVIPQGQAHCGVCGSRAPSAYAPVAQTAAGGYLPAHADLTPVGLCPKCMVSAPGVGYFSTGANLAKLIFLTLITSGAMGVGGIVYFVVRKDHRVCPRCGAKWGPHGQRAVALAASGGRTVGFQQPAAMAPAIKEESSFSKGSIVMYMMAAILLIVGISAFELAPFLFGIAFAGGGFALQQKRQRDREQRREALLAQLQQPVLKLAGDRGGRLTVTEVASTFGWPIPRAEKVLNSLDDGLRVTSDVTDEGVIVYEFPELRHRRTQLPRPAADSRYEGGSARS